MCELLLLQSDEVRIGSAKAARVQLSQQDTEARPNQGTLPFIAQVPPAILDLPLVSHLSLSSYRPAPLAASREWGNAAVQEGEESEKTWRDCTFSALLMVFIRQQKIAILPSAL